MFNESSIVRLDSLVVMCDDFRTQTRDKNGKWVNEGHARAVKTGQRAQQAVQRHMDALAAIGPTALRKAGAKPPASKPAPTVTKPKAPVSTSAPKPAAAPKSKAPPKTPKPTAPKAPTPAKAAKTSTPKPQAASTSKALVPAAGTPAAVAPKPSTPAVPAPAPAPKAKPRMAPPGRVPSTRQPGDEREVDKAARLMKVLREEITPERRNIIEGEVRAMARKAMAQQPGTKARQSWESLLKMMEHAQQITAREKQQREQQRATEERAREALGRAGVAGVHLGRALGGAIKGGLKAAKAAGAEIGSRIEGARAQMAWKRGLRKQREIDEEFLARGQVPPFTPNPAMTRDRLHH